MSTACPLHKILGENASRSQNVKLNIKNKKISIMKLQNTEKRNP